MLMMDRFSYYTVPFGELDWTEEELYLQMGYGEHVPTEDVKKLVNGLMEEIAGRVQPYCGYVLVDGKIIDRQSIGVNGFCLNTGGIITHAMKEADCYAFFTATVGKRFDDYCHDFKTSGDTLRFFIADAIGSVLAEAVVNWLMKKLAQKASEENWFISNNYSPGYCDWPLTDQKKIFSLFPAGMTQVELTDSCLMVPIKSVSGIVAVGAKVKKRPYGCDICKMTQCIKNKKRKVMYEENTAD